MKSRIYYAVFSYTESGKDYLVKGRFGSDKAAAEKWAENNVNEYPKGLHVQEIKAP